ncbi:MAG: DUF1318 domain-containing protein [bacterium]
MKKSYACVALLAVSLSSAGCISSLFNVNLNVVGEQTALEKQVLGTYKSLGEDLMVYSSVRGVDESGSLKTPPASTDSQRAACTAMRNRDYNRDDVQRILAAGIAGEGKDGQLIARKEAGSETVEGLTREQVIKLVEEENGDRRVVVERLATTTPNLTSEQRAQVGSIFAQLNHEIAPAGTWLQNQDGSWRRK